jgi:two-component system chemotaxis sensor kinase CheA
MKTRMLPIGKVFNKFPRMIRDLSRELGKKIELEISGEETELDKSIVEEIGDPLVHIIRNSCDHGVESIEKRVAAGKSETGIIGLKAYNEGNHIVIQITDDGAGMDPDRLKMIAIDKGVISEKEADIMGDKEAFGLIFRPGFSTAAQVTNVSGRGVGMDVVKTNIEKLNGIIDIESELEKGTVMKLKIPLTLAIIQALLVGVQEEYYAIPLASVLETVRINKDEIYTVENRSVMRLRDEVLSLVHIADIFEVERVFDSSEHAYVVVLGLAETKIGLIVDTLVGQEEIVIKSMGEYLHGMDGIAGATIRGDGGVTLIVDVAAIMQMAKTVKSSVTAESGAGGASSREKAQPSDYKVMIIDDSKTDRKIMTMALKPLGITLVEATDGVEALNTLKSGEHHFDALLIDIEMPRMDGYTLASEIKKYNKYKNLPLIAVTSRSGKADRMRGVESGMVEYITKPYSPDYLQNVVKRNIKFTFSQETAS